MNILFFLSPKQDLMYVYDDFTLRQTLEKWENNRYASIPVLNRKGEYVGTLTEGDILWGLKKYHGLDLEAAEDIPISEFAHKRDYKAVTVTTSMDELVEAAMSQNFVPVVDDRGIFIGIVRRQAIIRYCYDKSRKIEISLYLSSLAQISSAAFLPLISIPPKIGPMRKLPLTPLAAIPETNSPG